MSWFACWDPQDPGGLLHRDESDVVDTSQPSRVNIEVIAQAQRGTKRQTVSATKLSMADAIDLLGTLSRTTNASPSAQAWASGIRSALSLVADGRVLPWISPEGFDTWRLDPLDTSDLEYLEWLVSVLPAEAHALATDKKGVVGDPAFAMRSLYDAVADRMIRTAAASRVGPMTLFAGQQPTKAPHLRPWVNDLATAHCATSRLVIRVHPPEEDASDWQVVFQLQSRSDPSLVVNASDFWQTPTEVMERLGDQVELILLSGLRRLLQMVAPFEEVLDQVAPASAVLSDPELDLLLDQLDDLADAGIDVRWPSELVAPKLERQLVVSAAAPSGALPSVTDLESLLSVDWEFLLDGVALTRSELDIIGDAKRSVVPLRGKWVRLTPHERARLKARVPAMTPTMALAAALGTDISLEDDEDGVVGVRVEGAMADIADRLAELGQDREEAEPAGLQAELRPYQRRGLAWMVDLCSLGLGGCLADDMGLGKTLQVLALHATRGGPTLVVCPTSLLGNWEREAHKFLPDATVRIFHGASRDLADVQTGEIVVTTYGVVRTDAERLNEVPWDLVVADEAQYAKNPQSRTAKALREIEGRSRIALTGTPVENRLSELWSIIDWAVPGLLGPLATFRRQIATPIERDNDREATFALNQLTRPFLLRRKKTDPGIAPELPAKLERDLVVPLSAEQVTLYKAAVEESLAEVANAEGIERRGLVLKLLTGLKQITNHPAQFLKEDGPLDKRSGKLDALDDLLLSTRANGEATLIFTQYVKMGELLTNYLAARGHRIEMLHGGQSVSARQDLVDRFQDRELDVLVLSLKAGGTGLNLTAATNVVHYDRWWNPAVEDQATDRAYRIGQTQVVTVHRIITEGTVEDRVAELLRLKRDLADRVVGTGEGWIGELDDDELSRLVTLESL